LNLQNVPDAGMCKRPKRKRKNFNFYVWPAKARWERKDEEVLGTHKTKLSEKKIEEVTRKGPRWTGGGGGDGSANFLYSRFSEVGSRSDAAEKEIGRQSVFIM